MNLKTRIHSYYFNTNVEIERTKYKMLVDKLKGMGLKCFCAWGGLSPNGHYKEWANPVADIELETEHLFNNQWNTSPIKGVSDIGLRVFDWAEDYPIDFSKSIKKGHWIEQTKEMNELRWNTLTCGYCGRQEPAAKGYVFCPHCLGSTYLRQDELRLLRMLPCGHSFKAKREELTEAEKAHLLPLYLEAQKKTNKKKAVKQRAKILEDYRKADRTARTERDGKIWLIDHGYTNLNNVIYYAHRDRFCFGWVKKFSEAEVSQLLDVLGSEFPFDYDIKKEGQS